MQLTEWQKFGTYLGTSMVVLKQRKKKSPVKSKNTPFFPRLHKLPPYLLTYYYVTATLSGPEYKNEQGIEPCPHGAHISTKGDSKCPVFERMGVVAHTYGTHIVSYSLHPEPQAGQGSFFGVQHN